MARAWARTYDRLVRRLADWALRLPPRMQDLALALALAAYYVGSLIPVTSQLNLPVAAFVLVVLQALPLTWRRRWPLPVLFAVGIPSQVYAILGIPYGNVPFGPMIAYYTVMDRSSTRTRWAISLLVVFGLIRVQFLPYHTAYSFFTGLLEFGVAGIAGVFSRTHRAYTREVEARAEQAEAERERQVALAAAQERTRIARELHDVVAHHVSLMAVQSEAAASLLPDRPAEAGRSVQIIGDTAREALTELRRLLGVLRGPAEPGTARQAATAPAPSISELDEVLVPVRQAGIAVNLRVEGNPSKLAPGVDLAAYRIVQEALTNTVRHSGAAAAAVTVSYEPGYVTVSVTDTGHGAPAPIAATVGQRAAPTAAAAGNGTNGSNGGRSRFAGSGGFGLAGIAERVASCGGSLTVGPGRAGGFAVTAKLPTP
jgi:signal transduction histidine kinase